MIKKLYPAARVYGFLKKYKLDHTKEAIRKYLNLSKNAVNVACRELRKQKKIGYSNIYSKTFPARIEKTYWGIGLGEWL